MSRKRNTRSIKKIEEGKLARLDTKLRLERQKGKTTNAQPSAGQGWAFIPAPPERR